MARQSDRLLAMGYYDEEPRVSYKESSYKVFRRKRGRRHSGASTISNMSSMSFADNNGHHPDRNRNRFWSRFSLKTAVSFLFIVLMCFGGCLYKVCASRRTCLNQSSGWPEDMERAGNEVRMLQAQLLKLQEDVGGADVQMMRMQLKELQEELLRLKNKLLPVADTMSNYALESQGAAVLNHLSSETYNTRPPQITFWGVHLWYPPATPRTVIQGHSSPLTPGRCWAFAGRQGHVFVSLSHLVIVTHVTLGHITSTQSPVGFAYSAPKEFSVYGLKTVDGEVTHLGTFAYDPNGESLQTFRLPGQAKDVFRFVKLQIDSNCGHPEYTCVYNFRVHGKMPQMSGTI